MCFWGLGAGEGELGAGAFDGDERIYIREVGCVFDIFWR